MSYKNLKKYFILNQRYELIYLIFNKKGCSPIWSDMRAERRKPVTIILWEPFMRIPTEVRLLVSDIPSKDKGEEKVQQ